MNRIASNFDRLNSCILKCLILTNSGEVVRVPQESIAYIVSDDNYSSMVLTDSEKHIFSFNLATFEKILAQ